MQQPLPKSVTDFKVKYPEVWEAFATLGDSCHQTGPLDEKTRRLVKLGIAIAYRHEGAVHSAARNALESGLTAEEMFHAAILAITTVGWPTAYAAMTWIDDAITKSGEQPVPPHSCLGRRDERGRLNSPSKSQLSIPSVAGSGAIFYGRARTQRIRPPANSTSICRSDRA